MVAFLSEGMIRAMDTLTGPLGPDSRGAWTVRLVPGEAGRGLELAIEELEPPPVGAPTVEDPPCADALAPADPPPLGGAPVPAPVPRLPPDPFEGLFAREGVEI